jgi:hypothetical protein
MRAPVSGQPLPEGQAKLEYRDGSFRVLEPGSHVTCAVTGKRIPLSELRYWNVERQEAYVDAWAALEAMRGKTVPDQGGRDKS